MQSDPTTLPPVKSIKDQTSNGILSPLLILE